MAEARHAIQKNEIYAFLLIPEGTEAGLMAQKQPKISFYYSSVSLAAGSLLFRDLKTISTLGGAAAGMAKLSALGKTTKVNHVTSEQYAKMNPASANRPAYSILENYMMKLTDGYKMADWQDALDEYMKTFSYCLGY